MLTLLPELKQLIAGKDQKTWFRMWYYDPYFRTYSESETGRKLFVDLFTTMGMNCVNDQTWRLFDKLHRENDLPAAICRNGTQYWWLNGLLHRDSGLPAAIYANGTQMWYLNGLLHRDSGLPAVIWTDGTQEWWLNGVLHRENDLPAVVYPDGTQEWWENGKQHAVAAFLQ